MIWRVSPATTDTEVFQEIKNKEIVYCVLIHNKYNLLKFALKAPTAIGSSLKVQKEVNKTRTENKMSFMQNDINGHLVW